jgi:hypothetical protein
MHRPFETNVSPSTLSLPSLVRVATINHHSIDVTYTLDLEFYMLEGHSSPPHTSLVSPKLYTTLWNRFAIQKSKNMPSQSM